MLQHTGLSATVDDDKIYAFGGYDSKGATSNKLHIFDLKTGAWCEVAVNGTLPSNGYCQMAVAGKSLWIQGGVDHLSKVSNKQFRVNLFDLSVEEVSCANSVERSHGSLVKLNENTLYIVGGKALGQESKSVWELDIEKKTWEVKGEIPKLTNVVCVFAPFSQFYVLGNKLGVAQIHTMETVNSGSKILLFNPEFSDMTLHLASLQIPAHKSILSQIAKLDLSGSQLKIDLDPTYFVRILKYAYGFKLTVSGNDLFHLVNLAQDLNFKDLEVHCVHQLTDLSPQDNLDLLEKTETKLRIRNNLRFIGNDNLKNLCLDNYQKSFSSYNTKEAYDKLCKMDRDLFMELITTPKFEGDEGLVPEDKERHIQISEHFSSLLHKKLYTDCSLISKNEIHVAHKALFLNSPHIMKLLKKSSEIDLKDVDPLAVKLYCKMVYEPETELDEKESKVFEQFCAKYDVGFEAESMGSSKFQWDVCPNTISVKDKYTISQSTSDPRLAFCSRVIKKGSSDVNLQVKVKYVSWIGVGVANADKVSLKDFTWNYGGGATTHGTNLWSMNGYTWTSNPQTHSKQTLGTYVNGDVIDIKISPKKGIVFMKKVSDTTWNELPVTFPVCLCANLGGSGDEVEILQKKVK